MYRLWAYVFGLVALALPSPPVFAESPEEEKWSALRVEMVETIQHHARFAASALDGKPLDKRVLGVIGRVPRHLFVPNYSRPKAYANRPLPIGFGQTISQPFIVALMTHLSKVEKDDVILEIGTGSGYQAAILAHLVQQVCTIEIIPGLAQKSADLFKRLELSNIKAKTGDGYYGWAECGPFDAIVVTAAATHVPLPLIRQLKPGGRMVIPVGSPFATQQLMLVTRLKDGRAKIRQLLPVVFVPLTGGNR